MEGSPLVLMIFLLWGGCVIVGIVVGIKKNRLFEGLVATLLLWVVGLIWIASVKAKVICPRCKSKIDADAKKCRYCGYDVLLGDLKKNE